MAQAGTVEGKATKWVFLMADQTHPPLATTPASEAQVLR
jgi:hypothetical protein